MEREVLMINRMIMCFLSLLIAFTGSEAFAEWKPNKPITMMVIFPPGGGGDTLGRATAAFMEKRLGSKIVVENRRGGGGAAMAKVLVKRKPDGYTIGMAVTETFSFAPVLNPKIGYGATDFTHLGSIANTQRPQLFPDQGHLQCFLACHTSVLPLWYHVYL